MDRITLAFQPVRQVGREAGADGEEARALGDEPILRPAAEQVLGDQPARVLEIGPAGGPGPDLARRGMVVIGAAEQGQGRAGLGHLGIQCESGLERGLGLHAVAQEVLRFTDPPVNLRILGKPLQPRLAGRQHLGPAAEVGLGLQHAVVASNQHLAQGLAIAAIDQVGQQLEAFLQPLLVHQLEAQKKGAGEIQLRVVQNHHPSRAARRLTRP